MKPFSSRVLAAMVIPWLFLTGCGTTAKNPLTVAANTAAPHLTGTASWYRDAAQGQRTASGEAYDGNSLSAAHRTMEFGTRVEITNSVNARRVQVKINDRGPADETRLIDVSKRAALELGMLETGVASVVLRIVSIP